MCDYFSYSFFPAFSLQTELYFNQNGIADQFQEPIAFDDFAAGKIKSEPVDLGAINEVPVSLIVASNDEACSVPYAERIFEEMQNAEKYIRYEEGFNHTDFIVGDSAFTDRMVDTIEFGALDRRAADIKDSSKD